MPSRSFLPYVRCLFVTVAVMSAQVGVAAVAAGPVKPGKVEVELVADGTLPRAPGRPTRLGLRMKMDPGWHTYWKNPGDAGLPTKLTWTVPPGWSAGPIDWPAPERIPIGPLASYGYEGEIVLPVIVFVGRDWDGRAMRLQARAEWLVCKESCIPESADLAIDVTGSRAAPTAHVKSLFVHALDRQPRVVRRVRVGATRTEGRLELTLGSVASGQFFPDVEELIEPGDPPRVKRDGPDVVWSARLGTRGRQLAAGAAVRGVWVPTAGQPVIVDTVLAR